MINNITILTTLTLITGVLIGTSYLSTDFIVKLVLVKINGFQLLRTISVG